MYKLGFIDGYSRFNQPRFATLAAQKAYFDYNVDIDIDAYYPPHYTNKIKINTTLNSISKINFVIIIHKNKYYYYFVDSIKYINEDIMEISITMDTIQTFMFDVKINYGNLERETIARWSDTAHINRNYIRENISNGIFINNKLVEYGVNRFLVVIRNKISSDNNDDICYIETIEGEYIPTGVVIEIIPLPSNDYIFDDGSTDDNFQWVFDTDPTTTRYNDHLSDFNNMLSGMLSSPNIHNIFLMNNRYINSAITIRQIVFAADDIAGLITINPNIIMDYRWDFGYNGIILKKIKQFKITNTETLSIDNNSFIRNSSDASFNKRYYPQIIDENYMNIEYGERKAYSKYPLSKLTVANLLLQDYVDFYEGIRGYHLTVSTDNNNSGTDKYDSWAINSLPQSFNLINNAWTQYQATHKASLTQGRDLAYDEIKLNMGMTMLKSSVGAAVSMMAEKNPASSIAQGVTAPIGAIISNITTREKFKVADDDLKYTPNTIGQGMNIISEISNGCSKTVLKVEFVSDIEAVIKYFETYGYKVNKFISNKNIYDLDKNRYYYNFYKFSDIRISQTSSVLSYELIADIEDRLNAGIRFFENGVNTLQIDYTKDNYDVRYES